MLGDQGSNMTFGAVHYNKGSNMTLDAVHYNKILDAFGGLGGWNWNCTKIV